ncbi:flavonol 3-O-glucosyltransferase UGT89B1 [Vicia villosa]|uniref:flavonol 3-O-glucosyltransferase UGT89B1 n=1 Tax=Vicia villosa TaxID=3911 RepID=UPI00273CE58B|nr:flavonol 3-O-glucosyltransferase UGT89B1 [Vicia villosa]
MTAQTANTPPHVLVIPFPAQGHMIPLLDLTHKLATTNKNITITILTTPKNHTFLTPLLNSHPSIIHPLILPFPSNPSIPHAVENARDLPNSFLTFILSLSNLHHPLLQWFHSHPSPPRFIISDMFSGWTQHLASQLNIPRLVFSPSGAFAFSTMCFLWKNLPTRVNPTDENEVVSYQSIPNSPNYPWWQVSPLFRSYVPGDADSEKVRDLFLCNTQSWGLIVNTFDEVEKPYIDYLKTEMGNDRVWAVGPLLPMDDDNDSSTMVLQRGGSSSVSANDIVSWLDKREDRKVVYVCFGSQTILTKEQTDAIAFGLSKSGVHFIWSIKEDAKTENELVVGRGLVIRGWVPQVLILRHRAVGAFLTHCGWNSVLESVVAGVSMLAWPMTADQYVNATLVVDELKVGKRVCEGGESVPDSDELGRVLADSVGGSGEEIGEALKLQQAALGAVRKRGSSDMDLRCLMEQLVL